MRRTATGLAAAAASIIVGLPLPAVPQTAVHSIEVEKAAFRIMLSDARVAREAELPGIRLVIGDGSGEPRTICVDAVERDPKDPAGEVVLYAFSGHVGEACSEAVPALLFNRSFER